MKSNFLGKYNDITYMYKDKNGEFRKLSHILIFIQPASAAKIIELKAKLKKHSLNLKLVKNKRAKALFIKKWNEYIKDLSFMWAYRGQTYTIQLEKDSDCILTNFYNFYKEYYSASNNKPLKIEITSFTYKGFNIYRDTVNRILKKDQLETKNIPLIPCLKLTLYQLIFTLKQIK